MIFNDIAKKMKQIFATLLILGFLNSYSQSIMDLDFLIGKWEVSEIVAAGTENEYLETGTRDCAYYLDGSYIKCETQGKRHGKNRQYTFLINYHPGKDYFQFISLSGDYPDFGMSAWVIDENADIIQGRSIDGYESIHSIDFTNKDRIIWQGLYPRANGDAVLELKPLWTETASRM